MARARFIPPNSLVEITMRTNQSRLYLRPSAELNLLILAILGRALHKYRVVLHAFVFLSNHWHALATASNGKALSSFLRYVHGEVAKAAQRVNGVTGKVWQGKKARIIPVLDDEAQLERLRYLLAHGTKEGLVASPLLWPGISSAGALAENVVLVGKWVNRKKLRELRRAGRIPDPADYIEEYPIALEPLPVHKGLSGDQIGAEVKTMLAQIEAEHPGPHLGVARVLAQDPLSEPRTTKTSTVAPQVHTTSSALRTSYLHARSEFHRAYAKAALSHAEQPTLANWPLDTFLPASQFVQGEPAARHPTLLQMVQPP